MLNLFLDVFLDIFIWFGGNIFLEAIVCNLLIVICFGEFMCSCYVDSFLKMLGVIDIIVKDEVEYIYIVVKLGLEIVW